MGGQARRESPLELAEQRHGIVRCGTLSGLGAESLTPFPFLFGALPPRHSFFLVPWNLKIDNSERGTLSVPACDFSLKGRLEGLMAWNHASPICGLPSDLNPLAYSA